ncbi:MAG: gamma-glutamyltransferase family protein, partial [Candidatus Binatia bacterium]
VYDAKARTVSALNASGRSPRAATVELYAQKLDSESIPPHGWLPVTVPGALDGWIALVERFGRMRFGDLLAPAIDLAWDGFAVAPHTALHWRQGKELLLATPESAATWLLPGGRAPAPGEVFRNERLARTLGRLAEEGRGCFYHGEIAREISRVASEQEGLLSERDLADHRSTWTEPLRVGYRGYEILCVPPNSQGLVVLEALRILENEDLASLGYGSAESIHLEIEAVRRALDDCRRWVADPDFADVPVERLLSPSYALRCHEELSPKRPMNRPKRTAEADADTAYVCVADADGNVASLITSLYIPWGSGVTVGDTGILLQNRGAGFTLERDHPNRLEPNKRPRHTLAPAMMLADGRALMAFGFVGGDMQVQAQVQLICSLVDFRMNLQNALDAPRWRYDADGGSVALEDGVGEPVAVELGRRGHHIVKGGGFFGGGQALLLHPEQGSFHGASDSRRDGCALGY